LRHLSYHLDALWSSCTELRERWLGLFGLRKDSVLGCCSAGLDWIGAVVLDFGGRFSVELVGVGPEVLTEG